MTEQELAQLEAQHDLAERLAHPDPDPDLLPTVIDSALVRQEQIAAHVLRAVLRLEDDIERQTDRMKQDIAAWQEAISRLQTKRDNWREMIRSWMERTGTRQIKCPWFTASLANGRSKIVVDDEEAAIQGCKLHGYTKAVRVKESLVKAEFEAIYNAIPAAFPMAHEETGEPTLLVRRK